MKRASSEGRNEVEANLRTIYTHTHAERVRRERETNQKSDCNNININNKSSTPTRARLVRRDPDETRGEGEKAGELGECRQRSTELTYGIDEPEASRLHSIQ